MAKPKVEKPAFKTNCEVILSEAELKACAKALAEALNGKTRIESEVTAFRAQKKAEQTQLESVIQKNTLLLNTGKEFRMVECEWDYDWKGGKKTGRRVDTGEVVAKEEITIEERQLDFAPKEGKTKPAEVNS
jgi:hypothetical protein